jgi:hypothetical protein
VTPLISNPVELRARGFEALVKELGWVNAVRFIRDYETGSGDYTRERPSLLPAWDADRVVTEALRRHQA